MRNWSAGLVVETEDSFRVAPENFLAEGEKQMLEKILKVPRDTPRTNISLGLHQLGTAKLV